MTLPVSGQISMSQVNVELMLAASTPISLGQASVRTLFGVASGAISMSNGHGKSNTYLIEYLVIGGGGAGFGIDPSPYNGPGGGAGGYLASSIGFTPSSLYTIVVGAGGTGNGGNGNSSSISGQSVSITALPGGGAHQSGSFGSGGGISQLGTAGQGYNGGTQSFTCCWNHTSGGGGGAGGNANGVTGGAGAIWLDGIARAGGGGGGIYPEYYGYIGPSLGGGGVGGRRSGNTPTGGTTNTGSGGGGASHGGGSINGGSGVVILRYAGAQKGTGGTVTSAGGYTYHTFNSSGIYTA